MANFVKLNTFDVNTIGCPYREQKVSSFWFGPTFGSLRQLNLKTPYFKCWNAMQHHIFQTQFLLCK